MHKWLQFTKLLKKRYTIIRVNRIILLYDCEAITIIVREAAVQAGYGRRRNDGCHITVLCVAVVMFGRRLSLPGVNSQGKSP